VSPLCDLNSCLSWTVDGHHVMLSAKRRFMQGPTT
jgi:hypothetical protein